ncbi:hypothetical protein FQN54_003672 [Arachnomyces sp. PD_36]|nr:hypothetical protein FQN54_003672 [Arachnomyces sp. PD_36]
MRSCLPEDRSWPDEKCERCIKLNHECSSNETPGKLLRDVASPDSGSGGSRRTTKRSWSAALTGSRRGSVSDEYQKLSRELEIRPKPLEAHGLVADRSTYRSPCSGLFEYLRDIDWATVNCNPTYPGSTPFAEMLRSTTCLVPDLSSTPIGKRQLSLDAFALSQRIIQQQPPASPMDLDAQTQAAMTMVDQLQTHYPRYALMHQFDDLLNLCRNHIQQGYGWSTFKEALLSDEILLIDENFSFDGPNPNVTFETCRRIWLSPSLGLKQFCLRFSGVTRMITDLALTEVGSPERLFLAEKIEQRIEEVLGKKVEPSPSISSQSSFSSIGKSAANARLSRYTHQPYSRPMARATNGFREYMDANCRIFGRKGPFGQNGPFSPHGPFAPNPN